MNDHRGHTNGIGPSWVVKLKLWPQGPLTEASALHDELYLHQTMSRHDADYRFLSDSIKCVGKYNKNVFFWTGMALINHVILRTCGWFMYHKVDKRIVAYVKKLFNIKRK